MGTPFKERINATAVAQLARAVAAAGESRGLQISEDNVLQAVVGLEDRELKDRVHHVADHLQQALRPLDVGESCDVLVDAAGPPLTADEGVSDRFDLWPLLTWVEVYAVDHPAVALPALRELTRRFSAEFALRPFLRRHPDAAWAAVHRWTTHPCVHVRRLASEGTRPRLPWGGHLRDSITDPSRGLAVLDALVDDPERYVQRSVANHLGDIAKDHPERAVDVAERWLTGRPERAWVVRHGLRHLLKQGDPRALALHGFKPVEASVEGPVVAPAQVSLGETLELQLTLTSQSPVDQRLRVDLAVHFRKARGELRPKVFRWTELTLKPGEVRTLTRRQSLRAVSTRKHYPGEQAIDVRINGKIVGHTVFSLQCDPGT